MMLWAVDITVGDHPRYRTIPIGGTLVIIMTCSPLRHLSWRSGFGGGVAHPRQPGNPLPAVWGSERRGTALLTPAVDQCQLREES